MTNLFLIGAALVLCAWAVSYNVLDHDMDSLEEDLVVFTGAVRQPALPEQVWNFALAPVLYFIWFGPGREETRKAVIHNALPNRMLTFQETQALRRIEDKWL